MARVFPAELLKQLIGNNPNVRRGRDITFYETVVGFYHAVRWSEPWVAGLLAFHVAYGALVVATRRHQNLQLAFFLFTCAAVYCAQPLNGYLHLHWRRLGFTQDYFDPRGVFISTLYSGPLLVIALAQLVRASAPPPHTPQKRTAPTPCTTRPRPNSCTRCACPAAC